MGASSSVEYPPAFVDITTWPWARVVSVLKSYQEAEYDFGIDYTVIMNLTGYNIEEAKQIIAAHARNGSQVINAITCLVSIISLGDSEKRSENNRLLALFDLLDFNKAQQITMDELTILLLCIASSYAFILNRQTEAPTDQEIIKFTENIYRMLGKKLGTTITKEEFQNWTKDNVFSQGILTIDGVFEMFINSSMPGQSSAGAEVPVASSPKQHKKKINKADVREVDDEDAM